MKVRFHRLAKAELQDGVRFYEDKAAGLGVAFLDQVEEAIQRICAHPESAPVTVDTLRKLVLPTFPYNIIYRQVPNEIQILALAHQRREPQYWVGR